LSRYLLIAIFAKKRNLIVYPFVIREIWCAMKYRVGQRVRLLHASGDGVITALIDNHHVEVDLGDDFPLDVHIDELVPVDSKEISYLGKETQEDKTPEKSQPQLQGTSILELSLVLSKNDEKIYSIFIANPEPSDKLLLLYRKQGNQYIWVDAFQVEAGSYRKVGSLEEEELGKVKSFYVQALAYTPGKGHPHHPYTFELVWNRSRLSTRQRTVNFTDEKVWIFSLRADNQELDLEAISQHEFIRIKEQEQPQKKKRESIEVDLHAEALGINPYKSSSTDILQSQLAQVHKVLSDALAQNYEKIIFIHGIGEGKLRKAVREILKETSHVKTYAPADIHKYGNGATEVVFY
jgi:hypothetical protein